MYTVLVTGCAGFIGSHVCEILLARGYRVIGIDNFDPFYSRGIKNRNLENFRAHTDFSFYESDITHGLSEIEKENIDVVIHLAAKAGVRPSIEDPTAYLQTNIAGTQILLEFMKKKEIQKLVFASSSSVYGNNKKTPFNEDDNVDNPISPYAFTKKACELLNYYYHHLYDIDVINLRLFTVYGPRQRPDLAIYKFVKQIDANEPIVLFGNGNTARDYTYVEDTVNGIYSALEYCLAHEKIFETLNLGNNKPVQLNELVDKIYTAMGKPKNVIFSPMQPGDVDLTFADIEKAKRILHYSPSTSIDTGIKKFVEWFSQKRSCDTVN